jgi:hypothetical protein
MPAQVVLCCWGGPCLQLSAASPFIARSSLPWLERCLPSRCLLLLLPEPTRAPPDAGAPKRPSVDRGRGSGSLAREAGMPREPSPFP